MIKLTSIGRTKFFEYNYNLVDQNNIRFAYFDSTVSSADVPTICENWQHDASDLDKLASPSLYEFTDIGLYYGDYVAVSSGFTRWFNIVFKSGAIALNSDFTKDTNGYAAVIDVTNGNICLGYVLVMAQTKEILNEPGVEQSWSNDIVGKFKSNTYTTTYNTGAACYAPRQVKEIILGSIDMNAATFSIFYTNNSLADMTNPITETRSDFLNSFGLYEEVIVEDVSINNFRYDYVDKKYTFDPQFINFSADLGNIGSAGQPIRLAIEGVGSSGEKLPIVIATVAITNVRGGIFVSPDVDGFFKEV